jgi:aspartate aminotransferase
MKHHQGKEPKKEPMKKTNPGPRLSRRVRSLEVSPTVAMSQRAGALKARGVKVFDFSVGEPDQPTPAHVAAAGKAAIDAGRTKYTPAAGLLELRAAVVARYRQDFGVTFAPEEAAITVGGKQALYLIGQALFDKGDEVIVPVPGWPTFGETVRLAGATPLFMATKEKDGFRITAKQVARAVTARTRAVVLNTPSNPTGAIVEPEELLKIGELARRRDFTVLYDDTYGHLTFREVEPVLQALRDRIGDRLVVVGTASKTYCMTGWRIGWVLGPKALADACAALCSHSTQSPATFAQLGAVEALTGAQGLVRELREEYRKRRDFVQSALRALPDVSAVEPEGGFYAFPNLEAYLTREVPTTLDLGLRLLEEKGVALVPGEGFGAPGYARLSFARSMDELREGLARLREFLVSLREGPAARTA